MDYFPFVLQVDVTPKCNLSCLHCRTSQGAKEELSFKEWQKILDPIFKEFSGLIQWVAIGGGEPTLYPELPKLVEYFKTRTRTILLMTNGTTIAKNPQLLDDLIMVGLNRIQLSLESPEPKIHDQIRGQQGNFQTVYKAAKICVERKLGLAFRMTLNGLNHHLYKEFIVLCKKIGADEANLRRVIPVGNAQKKFSWDCICEKDYINLLTDFPRLEQEIGIYVNSEDPYRFLVNPKFVRCASYYTKSLRGCPAGTMYAYINPEGKVRPCSNIPVVLGNLKNESFLEIWNNHQWMIRLRERNYKKCIECRYKYICGGCRAMAYAQTGDWWEEDLTCWM